LLAVLDQFILETTWKQTRWKGQNYRPSKNVL